MKTNFIISALVATALAAPHVAHRRNVSNSKKRTPLTRSSDLLTVCEGWIGRGYFRWNQNE